MKNLYWLRLVALMATVLSFLFPRPALAEPSSIPDGEPMTHVVRGSILKHDDADAALEVIRVCRKFAAPFQDGSATEDTVDQLANEMAGVTQRHFTRVKIKTDGAGAVYFRGWPSDIQKPSSEQALTCRSITGVAIPARHIFISRTFYAARMDKWRREAYAKRHPDPKPAEAVAKADEVKTDDKAEGDKKPDAPVAERPIVPAKPPVGKKPVEGVAKAPAEVANACMPSTFEVRSETAEGLTLAVKPGANYWQLKNSCWAKKYETAPAEVILANKAEVTIPYCTAKPHTLPSLKDFDPQRWSMGKKGFLKIGDAANKAFVEGCVEEGRLGYALQAGQKLFLPKKQAQDSTAAEQAKKAADAKAEADKKAADEAAEAAKKVAEAKKAEEEAKKAAEADAGAAGASGAGGAASPSGSWGEAGAADDAGAAGAADRSDPADAGTDATVDPKDLPKEGVIGPPKK